MATDLLETQALLREHGLDHVAAKYKLKARRGKDDDDLVCLRYLDGRSDMSKTPCKECRGVVLSEAQGWQIVALPYPKFFNYNERHAAKLDWESAKVFPKLDGSIATLYHHRGEWNVASSGLPDASGTLSQNLVFREMFWEIWEKLEYKLPGEGSENMSFMFEMLDPRHEILCKTNAARVVLHGVRCRVTGEETDHEAYGEQHGWEYVKPLPLGTIDDCINAAKAMNPYEEEGYVVRDKHFRRVKVKSPAYVSLSHLSLDGKATGARLVSIVLNGEVEEFSGYFPQYDHLLRSTDAAVKHLSNLYDPLVAHMSENSELLLASDNALKTALLRLDPPPAKSVSLGFLKTVAESHSSLVKYLKSLPQRMVWGLLKQFIPPLTSLFSTTPPAESTATASQKKTDKKKDVIYPISDSAVLDLERLEQLDLPASGDWAPEKKKAARNKGKGLTLHNAGVGNAGGSKDEPLLQAAEVGPGAGVAALPMESRSSKKKKKDSRRSNTCSQPSSLRSGKSRNLFADLQNWRE